MPEGTILADGARISIVGGGPGGLFLAILLRKARPGWEVAVYERNPPGATYGFGVVFTARTVRGLHDADPDVIEEITTAFESWTDIEVALPSGVARSAGHDFSALERRRLLDILGSHAETAGVQLHFGTEVDDLEALRSRSELVVGADGANSQIRDRWSDEFRPSIHQGSSVFAWFATPRRYDALTFHFVDTEFGAFATHAYPFSPAFSTFIVETDEATWRRAGLDARENDPPPPGENDELGLAFCQDVFAESLRGHHLIGNNSRWSRFPTVRNESWSAGGNVVILGDAAHTAHFSVGSGTKMAMEDAAALAGVLTTEDTLGAALSAYQQARQPQVQRLQDAAEPSRAWWESFGCWVDRDLSTFSVNFLTRTGRELLDSLHKRDERFAAANTRHDVLTDRVEIAGKELGSRLAVLADEAMIEQPLAGSVTETAAMILVPERFVASCGDRWNEALDQLKAHETLVAVIGLDVPEADFVVQLASAETVGISSTRPTIAAIDAPSEAGDHAAHANVVAESRRLEAAGAAALWLRPTPDAEVGRDGLLTACNRIRAAVSIPLIVSGAQSTLDAATLASAGRADVCVGGPGELGLHWRS